MVHKIVIQFQSRADNAVERCAEDISQFWRSSKNPGFASQPKISVVLTVACSAACSSSVNKGLHTDIYIVLIFFATGTYCNGLGLDCCWTWYKSEILWNSVASSMKKEHAPTHSFKVPKCFSSLDWWASHMWTSLRGVGGVGINLHARGAYACRRKPQQAVHVDRTYRHFWVISVTERTKNAALAPVAAVFSSQTPLQHPCLAPGVI